MQNFSHECTTGPIILWKKIIIFYTISKNNYIVSVLNLSWQSERARKNAEGELGEASTRVNELTISITSLSSDKRRLESDLQSLSSNVDEAFNARRSAEERADRLQLEVNRLVDELHQERENYKNADTLRKQLEIEIREITVRLEEAEAFAQKEGKRLVAKLQARVSVKFSHFNLQFTSFIIWSVAMQLISCMSTIVPFKISNWHTCIV